jgi:hypothetical protein
VAQWGMRFAQVKEEAEGRGTWSKTHTPLRPHEARMPRTKVKIGHV